MLREGEKIQHEDTVVCSITRKVSLCKNSQSIPSNIENVVSNRLDCVPSWSKCDEGPLCNAEILLLPPLDGPFESLTEEDLAFFDKPDPGYPQAYENQKLE